MARPPAPPAPLRGHRHLRGPRQRLHHAPSGVPPELRGTYAGLGHAAAIAHLVDLGVTTVELLPIHQNVPEAFLVDRGLTNYWGYNTIGFFAPHAGYSAAVRAGRPGRPGGRIQGDGRGAPLRGIEVLLDVVFNHTAESDGRSRRCAIAVSTTPPTTASSRRPRRYIDTTGRQLPERMHPITLRLIMDSLRYWLIDMHVDGFRSTWRPRWPGGGSIRASCRIFRPGLTGPGGFAGQADRRAVGRRSVDSYALGRFPPLWSEWNGKYRDTMRDFWRSHPSASAISPPASQAPPTCTARRPPPTASVNLITVHDGFTLADLVAYDDKHNEANGEDNRTAPTTTAPGIAAPRPDRRPGHPGAARPPTPRDAGHAVAVLRRAPAARRRRAGPHPGWQQQRLLPGQRHQLVRLVSVDTELLAFTRR